MLKLKVKGIMSYRVDLLSDLLWFILFIMIYYYVWSAFKSNADVIGYVITISIMMSINFRGVIAYVMRKYRSGDIIFDLIRPLRFKRVIFWNWVGLTIRNNLLVIPLFLIAIFINPNIFFITSILLAGYLRFLIGFTAVMLFYGSYYEWGINNILGALTFITGGGIPYFLMPNFVKKLLLLNPFFYAMAAPWVASKNNVIILYQVISIIILTIISYLLEKRVLKKWTTVGV